MTFVYKETTRVPIDKNINPYPANVEKTVSS